MEQALLFAISSRHFLVKSESCPLCQCASPGPRLQAYDSLKRRLCKAFAFLHLAGNYTAHRIIMYNYFF